MKAMRTNHHSAAVPRSLSSRVRERKSRGTQPHRTVTVHTPPRSRTKLAAMIVTMKVATVRRTKVVTIRTRKREITIEIGSTASRHKAISWNGSHHGGVAKWLGN
jgi:hypothetical protein